MKNYDYDDFDGYKRPRKKVKKRRKKSGVLLFFKSLFLTVILCGIIFFAVYIPYTYLNTNNEDDFFGGNNRVAAFLLSIPQGIYHFFHGVGEGDLQEAFSVSIGETNLVVLGTDEDGTRTDTIMVMNYNPDNQKVTLISVPRDSYIEVDDFDFEAMQSEYPEPGSNGMKINAVYHYAPEGEKEDMVVKYVSRVTGLDIDYYALVDFDAFKYLVDSVGGIEYDVPMDMSYYDPEFDFKIDLKAGLQTLNGDEAEQLVRFRKGYANQDIGRVATQQSFVKELIKALATKDNIIKNPTAYITTAIKYVKTDIGLSDAVKYFTILDKINLEAIDSFTLPGTSAIINDSACYQLDETTISSLVADVENGTYGVQSEESVSSVGKSIVVLNGGYTSGLAGVFKGRLEADGFTVSEIGDYDGLKSDVTKIFVKNDGEGIDLQKYFTDSIIIEGEEDMPAPGDIVIVIGVEETA